MNIMKTSATVRGLIEGAIFVALSSGFAAVSTAASPDSYQVTVNYGDLDASSAQGANILYRRIHSAAEKACEHFVDSDLFSRMHKEACVNTAIEGAVNDVGKPALFAVYKAHKGTLQPIIVASDRTR